MITSADKVWAKQVILGKYTIDQVPEIRKSGVTEFISSEYEKGNISEEDYNRIFGIENKES